MNAHARAYGYIQRGIRDGKRRHDFHESRVEEGRLGVLHAALLEDVPRALAIPFGVELRWGSSPGLAR